MTTRTFVLGTRGSRLALAQSTTVARAIKEAGARLGEDVRVNLEVVRTHGDVSAAPLAALGGVGVFAAQLRLALLGGECDLAVHSFKDLPTAPTPGLRIAAVPQREDPRDALCAADGETLSSLPAGALVGTGSPRRAAQVLAARPDLRVCDLRGNVPTRLSR
ncbi:MAG: hydroxymethylbilane synthase, partial [Schaalia odontolytica]